MKKAEKKAQPAEDTQSRCEDHVHCVEKTITMFKYVFFDVYLVDTHFFLPLTDLPHDWSDVWRP